MDIRGQSYEITHSYPWNNRFFDSAERTASAKVLMNLRDSHFNPAAVHPLKIGALVYYGAYPPLPNLDDMGKILRNNGDETMFILTVETSDAHPTPTLHIRTLLDFMPYPYRNNKK
jgi:hypothetical protein